MARVKRGVTTQQNIKKFLKQVKGQSRKKKKHFRVAKQAMEKSMQYAYRDRKVKKEILGLYGYKESNAGARELGGLTYSKFMNGLNKLMWI